MLVLVPIFPSHDSSYGGGLFSVLVRFPIGVKIVLNFQDYFADLFIGFARILRTYIRAHPRPRECVRSARACARHCCSVYTGTAGRPALGVPRTLFRVHWSFKKYTVYCRHDSSYGGGLINDAEMLGHGGRVIVQLEYRFEEPQS